MQVFKKNSESETTLTELMIPSYANFGGKVHGGILLSLMDKIASTLNQSNLIVKPIFAPTVPEGQECLRICLHSFDLQEDISSLAALLTQELAE